MRLLSLHSSAHLDEMAKAIADEQKFRADRMTADQNPVAVVAPLEVYGEIKPKVINPNVHK